MKFIIYALVSTILVIQVQGDADAREELKEKYQNCLGPERFGSAECDKVFGTIHAEGAATIEKVEKYKLLVAETATDYNKCLASKRSKHDCDVEKSDRENIINQMKIDLYPWVEVYEMCDPYRPKVKCDQAVSYFHYPEFWGAKPENFINNMQFFIAFSAGKDSKEFQAIKDKIEVIKFSSEHESKEELWTAAEDEL